MTEKIPLQKKTAWVGVYRGREDSTKRMVGHKPVHRGVHYVFIVARRREDLPREHFSAKLVMSKTAPQEHVDDILALLKYPMKRLQLGHIDYALAAKRAISHKYYPKLFPGDYGKGLPYFLEAMTTAHLARGGFIHFGTTPKPRRDRQKQLERVGLPWGKKVMKRRWLLGMGRGIRGELKKIVRSSSHK